MSDKLPAKHLDLSAWYNDIIMRTELIDLSPVRGSIVFRPYGYAIWEHIQAALNKDFKKRKIENGYFPLLIPQSFLTKEAEHLEGFSPELAVVTHAGGKKLDEPYVIRPTSETIIYHMFSRWLTSYRDLPFKINQWANIIRWEMRTRPFLRTTEILWQEGHTAHRTREEAVEQAEEMLGVYCSLARDVLALSVMAGEKTPKERFAGGERTLCFEAVMPDGKSLQMGTSHLLLHSFPAAYGVSYQEADGTMASPWCTSWGVTTRLIGALIMVHGDDTGLVLPPRVAPIQLVITPIWKTPEEQTRVSAIANMWAEELEEAGIRVKVDLRDDVRPGAKFYHWEERGVPLRIELGMRDVENNTVIIKPRVELASIGSDNKGKTSFDASQLVVRVKALLDELHETLLARAEAQSQRLILEMESLEASGQALSDGGSAYRSWWCGSTECEELLENYKAGIRAQLPEQPSGGLNRCFGCTSTATIRVLVAKGY